MADQTKEKRNVLAPLLLALLFVVLLSSSVLSRHERLRFDDEPVTLLREGWTRNGGEPFTLPARLPAAPEEPVTVSRTLPKDVKEPVVLCFRSSHQRVRVLFEDRELYTFGQGTGDYAFGKSPGNAWHLVRMPEGCAGGRVAIELASPYRGYAGLVREVRLGTKAALLFHLIRTYFPSFAVTFLIFLSGMVLLVFYFLFPRRFRFGGEALHLGIFALLISVWMFGESRLTQFFVGDPLLNVGLTFASLLTFPIPLVQYCRSLEHFTYQRLMRGIEAVLYIQAAVVCVLQLRGAADFIEMVPAIHAVLLTLALVALVALLAECRREGRRHIRLAAVSLLLLTVFSLLETAWYYGSGAQGTGLFLRIGVLVFLLIQGKLAAKKAVQVIKLSRVATVDALTGCKNRTAYLLSLHELRRERRVAVVMVDLDNLKMINDTFGHEAGDDALARCARCLLRAFDGCGDCFRIGGDEFLFLGCGVGEEELARRMDFFTAACGAEEKITPYPLHASLGFALTDAGVPLQEAVRRADRAMYGNKKEGKKNLQENPQP